MLVKRIPILIAAVLLISFVPAFAATKAAAPKKAAPVKAAPAKAAPQKAVKADPNVVAVVNGTKITKQELEKSLYDWNGPMVLEELIDMNIINQEAKKQGIQVTDAEIKKLMDDQAKRLPPGTDLDEALKRMNMTRNRWKAMVKMQMQAEKIVRKSIKVTPDELGGYKKVSAIMIRIPYKQDEAEKAKAEKESQEKIAKVAAEIKGGLSFADAAKKNSEDMRTKEKGGDMGFIPKNSLPAECEPVLEKLKAGEVSEPIKTSFGYYLLKLDKTSKEMSAAEKKDLEEKIVQGQLMGKMNEVFLSLRNKAKITNYLSPQKPKPPAPKPAPSAGGPPPGVSDAEAGAPPPPPPAPPVAPAQ